jgi:hypothetical protein
MRPDQEVKYLLDTHVLDWAQMAEPRLSARVSRHEIPPGWLRLYRGYPLRLFAYLAAACAVHAHPIHTSIAEADYNRTTQKLEVALRVFIDDFETALSLQAKRRISLEQTPPTEFDALARAYLAETFTVRTREGAVAPPKWVGREIKPAANELWFYFEVPLPAGVEGARIRHGALFEQFPNQINSVRVRDADSRKVTLVFLPKQGEKTVRFHP